MSKEALESYQTELRQLIIKSIDKTLSSLSNKIPKQNKAKVNIVIQFKARKKAIEEENIKGNYTDDEYRKVNNQLRDHILQFIDDLEEEDIKVSLVRKYPIRQMVYAFVLIGLIFSIYKIMAPTNISNLTKVKYIKPSIEPIQPIMVKIEKFQIGKYEVTNREFAIFLNQKDNHNYIKTEELACKIKLDEAEGIFKIEKLVEGWKLVKRQCLSS